MILPELVCEAILTMKWFKRTAQGFNPGLGGLREVP